jgi:hypothetical protein
MNIEDPRWEEYETRFRALAEQVKMHKGPQAELASTEHYLFLYGENGLNPEQEFELLSRFEQSPERLRGVEVLTSYWEDMALYLT